MLLCLIVSVSVACADQGTDPDKGAAKSPGLDNSAAPGYIFDIINPRNSKPTDVEQAQGADTGIVKPGEFDIPVSPGYSVDALDGQAAQQKKAGVTSSPIHFLDFFYGSATTADADVYAFSRDSFFLLATYNTRSAHRNVHFSPSNVFGIRTGGWLKNYPSIGIAADFSLLQANAPGVSIQLVPISFVMMGRYPFLSNETQPDGQLQLYGGLMMSLVIGDIKVDFRPQMTREVGGSSSDFNTGGGVLFGIAWHFSSYAVFGEFRMIKASVDYDNEGGFLSAPESASADLETRQIVFGVSYKY